MTVDTSSAPLGQRRRSLKALLQLPLFPRRPALTHTAIALGRCPLPSGPRISLPEDLLHEILQELTPADILNLSLASSHLRATLAPELYRTMHLRSSGACETGLRLLLRRPDLCAHVRKLALRPNYYLSWPARDTSISESWVASMLCSIAPSLTNLRTFDWDGSEMAPNALWLTLRQSCPELKELYSNVGSDAIDAESELFKFSDLALFSLSVRHGVPETSLFPAREDLPKSLWDMLLNRCPDLAELTLCSFSAGHRTFALDPVVAGSWPRLTTLTLGAFGYDADFALAGPPPGLPAFLARHARVAALRLAWTFRRWMSPDDAAAFAQAALLPAAAPALAEFAGVVQQLPCAAAGACAGITALDLMCEPLYPARAPALCAALGGMPALVSLDLWVHVEPDLDAYRGFMGDLCAAAPGLEDFQFMCTTAFGKKPLTALAYALRGLPRLKSFALTKGHRYTDESMRASARRVFRAAGAAAPRLALVSMRWARAACRNHLKQEGTYERVGARDGLGARAAAGGSRGRGRGKGKGKAAGHEAAVVEAWERGLRAVGGAFERRYRFPL
ncbi:hypothetical protein GGX14DRAFT_544192 [Mycena pura]|uniref:F-box domain-containing protein n=1 Tax=Mycena pura TaxID=153505 RepID=A0AAD6Y9P3_9AGAR|nr:hypothetical protein GGX14DRAFT_544192 [Mycena pura]